MPQLGVGLVGAGPVTQAIHLPTLARLSELFRVVHVSDIEPGVADQVAAGVRATSSATIEAVLDDPSVEVVAICSPHHAHASQVIAACRAGKQAVLCEKPLAMTVEEAVEIGAASRETGVPVVVGAMHAYDAGWLALADHTEKLRGSLHTIRSSIVLPPNRRFEDLATEVISRPANPPTNPPADLSALDTRVRAVHAGVMGLAVHDLPLIRALLPRFDDLVVHNAAPIAPFGYQIVASVGGTQLTLHAAMSASWRPDWTLDAYGDDDALSVRFPPSYVHAGSATATLHTRRTAQSWGSIPSNGYVGEWRAVAAIIHGEQPPPAVDDLVDDLRLTLALADGAAAAVRPALPAEAAA